MSADLRSDDDTYDALIVGGGPAGCSCAIWLDQLGFEVGLIEQQAGLGGLQRISPYPNSWIAGVPGKTGIEFAQDLEAHVRSLGIPAWCLATPTRIEPKSKGVEVSIVREGSSMTARSSHLVIATGVVPRSGGLVAGENVLIGPGQRVNDHDFRGKRVAILGGGDNAAENYHLIRGRAAAPPRMFARTLRARPALLAGIPREAISVGPYVVHPGEMAVESSGRTEQFDVLVALYGWEARIPEALAHLRDRIVDPRGFIGTDADRRTREPRLWAIGEVTHAVHPCCVTAMGDGVICAKAIERFEAGETSRRTTAS